MPYGIKKSLGGDTPSVDKKMENCVNGILANPDFKPKNPKENRKQAAIKICKANIQNYIRSKK